MRVIDDAMTLDNASRDPENRAVALAASVQDVWRQLDHVFNENRTLTTLAKELIEKHERKGSSYATSFFNAVHRVSTAVSLVDKRIRATLSSHSRAILDDELVRARDVIAAIDTTQTALLSAHSVYESMQSPQGSPPLAIAFT